MHQDSIVTEQRYKKFIKKVCDTEIVYTLECEEGLATSSSNYYEDEEGEDVQIICFWSEKALAKSCIKDGWNNYEVSEMPLSLFMENWCVGMYNDELLIGADFDRNMFGYEAEPADLILELIVELNLKEKELDFIKFDNLSDLKSQILKSKGL